MLFYVNKTAHAIICNKKITRQWILGDKIHDHSTQLNTITTRKWNNEILPSKMNWGTNRVPKTDGEQRQKIDGEQRQKIEMKIRSEEMEKW